jgi:hypothetical protein
MKEYFDFLGTLPGVRELLQTLKPYFRLLRYPFFLQCIYLLDKCFNGSAFATGL